MTEYGPTCTPVPSSAPGWTMAVGCMSIYVRLLPRERPLTQLPLPILYQRKPALSFSKTLLFARSVANSKMIWSPGTTGFLKRTLSIPIKYIGFPITSSPIGKCGHYSTNLGHGLHDKHAPALLDYQESALEKKGSSTVTFFTPTQRFVQLQLKYFVYQEERMSMRKDLRDFFIT